jgi:hypothetical protein
VDAVWTPQSAATSQTFGERRQHYLNRDGFRRRMSKHDLRARPIYHHTRDSIEAHLSIVFAALAVGHWIEQQTNRLEHQEIRTHRTPQPHRHDPSQTANTDGKY